MLIDPARSPAKTMLAHLDVDAVPWADQDGDPRQHALLFFNAFRSPHWQSSAIVMEMTIREGKSFHALSS
jgi:hypothetical protein